MPQGEVKPPKQKFFALDAQYADTDLTLTDLWGGRIKITQSSDPNLPVGKTIAYISNFDPDDNPGNCHETSPLQTINGNEFVVLLRRCP